MHALSLPALSLPALSLRYFVIPSKARDLGFLIGGAESSSLRSSKRTISWTVTTVSSSTKFATLVLLQLLVRLAHRRDRIYFLVRLNFQQQGRRIWRRPQQLHRFYPI